MFWPPLLLNLLLLLLCRRRRRRRYYCCCCCCYFSTRDASRSTTRLNRLFLVLCFMERTQERVTAQQQQQ